MAPRYARVGSSNLDEESGNEPGSCSMLSAPLRALQVACPCATGVDVIAGVMLIVTVSAVITFSALHDLEQKEVAICDPLQISKHLHCVPDGPKPRDFAKVLEAQGTEREHYSVVEKQRSALRAANRTRHHTGGGGHHAYRNTYDDDWTDPAVMKGRRLLLGSSSRKSSSKRTRRQKLTRHRRQPSHAAQVTPQPAASSVSRLL